MPDAPDLDNAERAAVIALLKRRHRRQPLSALAGNPNAETRAR